MLRRSFEHEMFEEMRNAGLALWIVRGAVLVPNHVSDDRRAIVGNDDNLHAIVQSQMRNIRRSARARGRCARGERD